MIGRRLFVVSATAFAAAPRTSAAVSSGDVLAMKMIYLYQPNDVLLERGLQVDALAAYTKRLVAKANAVLSAAGPTAGASGALVVALKPPARSKVWVMVGEKAREAEFTSALGSRLIHSQ